MGSYIRNTQFSQGIYQLRRSRRAYDLANYRMAQNFDGGKY